MKDGDRSDSDQGDVFDFLATFPIKKMKHATQTKYQPPPKPTIFNPKQHMKGNRIEEDKFLNECRYQYIEKHELEREEYRVKKTKGLKALLDENPQVRSSAVHLMLYKHMLN